MQMVIFCGGLATRLGTLAKHIPKAMIPISGKPFLEHQINQVKPYGITDLVLCVGYLSEHIENYFGNGSSFGLNIKYSHDGKIPLGPMGALKKAEHFLEDTFFTLYGDSYLCIDYQNMYEFFKQHNTPAVMASYKNKDLYDGSNLVIKDNHIVLVKYKNQPKTPEMASIDYGTSLLEKSTIELIPTDTFYTTGEFYAQLARQGNLLAYEVKKRFYHIGTPEALQEFTTFISSKENL